MDEPQLVGDAEVRGIGCGARPRYAIRLLDALNAPEFDPWTLVDARWTIFCAFPGSPGELSGVPRLLQPVVKRLMARQMAGYHQSLRRNVEAEEPRP